MSDRHARLRRVAGDDDLSTAILHKREIRALLEERDALVEALSHLYHSLDTDADILAVAEKKALATLAKVKGWGVRAKSGEKADG